MYTANICTIAPHSGTHRPACAQIIQQFETINWIRVHISIQVHMQMTFIYTLHEACIIHVVHAISIMQMHTHTRGDEGAALLVE